MFDDVSHMVEFDKRDAATLALRGSTEESDGLEEESTSLLNPIKTVILAVDACLAVGNHAGLFSDWSGRIAGALTPGFLLFTLIKDNPALIAYVAETADLRATAATRKNTALVCVKLAARPQTDEHNKLCSDWAACLNYAVMQDVPVEAFESWMGTVKISDAKRAVAAAKRSGSTKPSTMAFSFKLQLESLDGPTKKVLRLPEAVHAKLLDAMTAPLTEAEFIRCLGEALSAYEAEGLHRSITELAVEGSHAH